MREAPPPRRTLVGLPRLLRPPGRELLDEHRPEHERRLRLHVDAHQRAARRGADPRRGGLRRLAQDLPGGRVPRVQGRPLRHPHRVLGPAPAAARGARRPADPARRASRASRPTTSSPPSPTAPSSRATRCVICTGDRDAFQLVSDKVTLLYPVRGVSDVWRMDPAAVTEKYLVPPERYSDLAALVGETSDNLPGVPGVGPKTAAKWLGQYGDLAGVVAHVDEIKGKAGENLREHLDGVLRNRRLNQLVDDLDLPLSVDDLERQSWDREEVHQVFDGLEFRVLRERLFATFDVEKDEVEGGFELEGEVFTADDLAVRFGDGAEGAAAAARRRRRGPLPRRQRRCRCGRARGRGRRHGPPRPHDADPRAGGRARRLAGRPRGPQGAARRQGAAAGAVHPRARRWPASRATPRWRPTWCVPTSAPSTSRTSSCATSAASSRPRRPPATRACSTSPPTTTPRRATRWCGPAPCSSSRPCSTTGSRRPAAPSCCATSSCRSSRSWRAWSAPASPSTSRRWPTSRPTSRPRCARPRRTPTTPSAAATSTSAAPSSCRRCSSTSSACPRPSAPRPATPPMPTRSPTCSPRPSTRSSRRCCAHRDTSRLRVTVEGLIKSVAPDRRIHTTYIQTIAATGRLSSTDPNLQNVPIRTEEGRRIREVFVVGEGYESLMSADYSQIEMRIMAHLSGDEGLIEAFRTGEDLHRFVGARVFDVEPDDVTRRDAQQGQGDELRPGLRAVGVRAVQAADHLHGRGAGADGRVLRPVRRGARLPARGRGRGPRHRLHRHDARPAPLPARPAQRQPAAPRGGRADGAQRTHPGLGRRHHQARDEGRRRGAARRRARRHGSCSRCTTSSCSRWRRASARPSRRWSAARWARPSTMDVPLDVSVGVGRSWHEAAH